MKLQVELEITGQHMFIRIPVSPAATATLQPRLTRREKEVLQAISDGKSNKEVASMVNLSERTVKFHVTALLSKFNVHTRGELVAAQCGPVPKLSLVEKSA